MKNNYDHPAGFKAAVALAAHKGGQSLTELAERFGITTDQVQQWQSELVAGAAHAFSEKSDMAPAGNRLFDSRELAFTIAENSTQGFAMMDERGYCVYANRAWLEMTGYSAAEIGSMPLHYLVHHHHPDGRPYPMEECPIDRALPENFEVRAHEDLFFRKDGSTFSVMCAASPIFEKGRPIATVIEIRDITERKRIDEELRESERRALEAARQADSERHRLDALLEAAPVGIAMADTNGKLIRINSTNRRLWGETLPLSESVDEYAEWKGWWADGSERHGRRVQAEEWALARALRGEEAPRDIVEIEPFGAPGVRRVILNSGSPIRDAEGRIIGAVIAQMDITDRIKAEEALRQADQRKDDFIAVLAHELRNPLAPIRTALDLLKIAGPSEPVLQRAQDAMARQLEHMTRLIDDLLDVARISRGMIQLKKEPCDIVQIVRQSAEDYRHGIQANGVRLSLHTDAGPLWIHGDYTRLMQIVSNLLHNASKFTKPGDEISASVMREGDDAGDAVIVEIKDTGAGIHPELLSQLFNPFIQANQDLGRLKGGLGLGLSLVKQLAELHGGTAHAHSPGEERGAVFTLRFPLMPDQQKPLLAEARKPVVPPTGLRVVVIEDNPDVLETMGMALAVYDHHVVTATNGQDGIQAIRAARPDVVLCDIGLPGALNGYAVAEAVRSDPALAAITLIALSGYGQDADKKKSKEAGFDMHLTKPVLLADLEAAMADVRRAGRDY